MSDKSKNKPLKPSQSLENAVEKKASRKLKAQRRSTPTVWSGLGMMGLIGWSVTITTLIGTMLGIWIDKHYQGTHSWTLMLLIIGLIIGCLNAWYWVLKEDKAIQEEREKKEDGK
jgi:ATP synthase protein I